MADDARTPVGSVSRRMGIKVSENYQTLTLEASVSLPLYSADAQGVEETLAEAHLIVRAAVTKAMDMEYPEWYRFAHSEGSPDNTLR